MLHHTQTFKHIIKLMIVLICYHQLAQPAIAAGIVTDSNAPIANQAGVIIAPNSVPIVNIVTPNSTGTSHNHFTDFNVGNEGAVFNNSATLGASALAGVILGNPNITSGNNAHLIIGEVTSSNASSLLGPMEVFGLSADVVIANPNGITCNGCGFINVPHATLATGTPQLDMSGALSSLSINGGSVLIEGSGLNAGGVSYLEILTRAAQINAAIHAGEVRIVTGRNDIDYTTGNVVAKADDASTKPVFGIDSSLLGGMYAGKIMLIGTEAGVGIRAPSDMVTSVDDLLINADGNIVLKNATSAGKINATSNSGSITVSGATHAAGNVTTSSSSNTLITSTGSVLSDHDISLTAGSLILEDSALIGSGIEQDGSHRRMEVMNDIFEKILHHMQGFFKRIKRIK